MHRQAMLVSFVNNGTAFFAGFVIFSLIGNMAYVQRKPISSVATSGPGLAFLVYPSGVAQMWLAPLWAALFFLMLFFVGIDSQFCTLEGFVTAVVDEWRFLKPRRELFLLAICLVSYGIGLLTLTEVPFESLFHLLHEHPTNIL